MKALHVRLEALSAAYPYPFLKSGTILTLPAPPFSSILGNLSACAGRCVGPDESQIGFEFESAGTALDLEHTRRLRMNNQSGRLSVNRQPGLALRQFHIDPRLDLYLTQLNFERNFYWPATALCLGRSQDLGWICFVRQIELVPIGEGILGSTLVRFPNVQVGGQILPPLADYFLNDRLGRVRRIGRLSRYQFVPKGAVVRKSDCFDLFHPDDHEQPDHVIVLHRLTS
jgi:CRISPR-associated protein Cas5t